MNIIQRFFTIALMLLAFQGMACAQEDFDYEQQNKAITWYADRIDNILTRFEGLRHDSGQLPQKCYAFPSEGAGSLGFAFAVSTWDEKLVVVFTPEGNSVKGKVMSRDQLPKEMYWNTISNMGVYATSSKDITLSQRPIPVRTFSKSKNSFVAVAETKEKINASEYTQMIFKPHKNAVRLKSTDRILRVQESGDTIIDEMAYEYRLLNPSVVAKMFRGYDDMEAQPWVVKNSFFDSHRLLQYTRWKEGEPIKKATPDVKRIISSYYGGRTIKDAQWVATLESGERTFYVVQFEHLNGDALAALVCIAEGEVASAWEFHGDVGSDYTEGSSIWFVDDEGDFMSHAPEIHCITATDKGMELYVRVYGGESVQYYILREIQHVLMEMQVDYYIYVWY